MGFYSASIGKSEILHDDFSPFLLPLQPSPNTEPPPPHSWDGLQITGKVTSAGEKKWNLFALTNWGFFTFRVLLNKIYFRNKTKCPAFPYREKKISQRWKIIQVSLPCSSRPARVSNAIYTCLKFGRRVENSTFSVSVLLSKLCLFINQPISRLFILVQTWLPNWSRGSVNSEEGQVERDTKQVARIILPILRTKLL